MSVEEIKSRFADEWSVLDQPEMNNALEVLIGRVWRHSRARDEGYRRAVALRPKRDVPSISR